MQLIADEFDNARDEYLLIRRALRGCIFIFLIDCPTAHSLIYVVALATLPVRLALCPVA